jgi:hypothetical protein
MGRLHVSDAHNIVDRKSKTVSTQQAKAFEAMRADTTVTVKTSPYQKACDRCDSGRLSLSSTIASFVSKRTTGTCPQAQTVAKELGLDLAQHEDLIKEILNCFVTSDEPSDQFERIKAAYKGMGGPTMKAHASPEVERHIVVYARTPPDGDEQRDAGDSESGEHAQTRIVINTCNSAAAFYPTGWENEVYLQRTSVHEAVLTKSPSA